MIYLLICIRMNDAYVTTYDTEWERDKAFVEQPILEGHMCVREERSV